MWEWRDQSKFELNFADFEQRKLWCKCFKERFFNKLCFVKVELSLENLMKAIKLVVTDNYEVKVELNQKLGDFSLIFEPSVWRENITANISSCATSYAKIELRSGQISIFNSPSSSLSLKFLLRESESTKSCPMVFGHRLNLFRSIFDRGNPFLRIIMGFSWNKRISTVVFGFAASPGLRKKHISFQFLNWVFLHPP